MHIAPFPLAKENSDSDLITHALVVLSTIILVGLLKNLSIQNDLRRLDVFVVPRKNLKSAQYHSSEYSIIYMAIPTRHAPQPPNLPM